MRTFVFVAFLFLMSVITCPAQVQVTMLDSSFDKDGKIIQPDFIDPVPMYFNTYLTAIATQGSKLLSASYNQNGFGSYQDSIYIARYNDDGSLDKSFGTNGFVSLHLPGEYKAPQATHLFCQSDGKIVLNTNHYAYPKPSVWGLARLNKDGFVDSTFGDNGFERVPSHTNAMIVLPNDKIVTANFSHINRDWFINLQLFNKDGSPLTLTTLPLEKPLEPLPQLELALHYTTDRKIVVAANLHNNNKYEYGIGLARFDTEGNIDSTFNGTGQKYIVDGSLYSYKMLGDFAVQQDNKIVMGLTLDDNSTFILKRLNVNGSFDTSFGENGTALSETFDNYAYVTALRIQEDNRIVAFGTSRIKVNGKFSLARFNNDGSLDSTFGTNGQLQTIFYYQGLSRRTTAKAMIIQPDGKIVCGGTIRTKENQNGEKNQPCLARYLPEKPALNFIKQKGITSFLKTIKPTVSISPNPVKNVLNISSKSLSYKNISVIDASGKVVLKDGFAGSNHSINVSGFSVGVYYLTIKNGESETEAIKFIKQ